MTELVVPLLDLIHTLACPSSQLNAWCLSAAGSEEAKALAGLIFEGLNKLAASAASGDAKATKRDYVEAVGALEAWAKLSGIAGSVQGL